MLINNVEELLNYINDDNNPYTDIIFADSFDYEKMILLYSRRFITKTQD